ncbi:MAG: ATP-binding cassette domain-containing protein [Gammaproteobacteria bacterium]|nr:ATP-binding cassette domain-containing protein [Gammaproteobacteria bacterium]
MSESSWLSTHGLRLTAGERTLCRDLNWRLQSGECWAILGLNGAGKTTLLHTLAGIHHPDQGEVRLLDQAMQTYSRRQVAQQLGLLLQESDMVFPGSVLEHVLIGRHPHLDHWQWEREDDYRIAQHALASVGLSDFAKRDIHTLSGGERQRMAIATVLAQQPRIFLLDEPVNHLDWHHQHQLLAILTGLSHSGTCALVMALHDVNLAARYCDHVLMMFANGEVKMGSCETLLRADTLSTLYGYDIEQINADGRTVFIPA